MNRPLVSVIMPTYNTPEEYLRQSIDSVLSQTMRDFELIVIDDGSDGNDIEIVKSYDDKRIVLIEAEHGGISRALNAGLDAAKAPYVARFDSDDICLPNRFERQLAYMDKYPNLDILSARMTCFGASTRHVACFVTNPQDMACALFFNCVINHPTIMMRADYLNKHGLRYDPNSDYAEDFDLWSRCIFTGQIAEIPEMLVRYRQHSTQVSETKKRRQTDVASAVRLALLAKLSLSPGYEQKRAHIALCTGAPDESLSLSTISNWAETLLAANARYKLFNLKFFESRIMCHYAVLMAKYFKLGNSDFSLAMSKKAFSPRWIRAYAARAALPLRLR